MTRRRHLIHFRTAVPEDAEALAAIDADSWPAPLATSVENWRKRLAVFPQGQLIAEYDGHAAVVAAAQRISEAFLAAGPLTHARLTDSGSFEKSHDPEGEIYQLVAVGASSIVNGLGLGRKLVDRQIEFARSLPGVKRIIGFTRPVRYYRHPSMPIDDYVAMRNKTGRLHDPVLEFHLGSGAKLVTVCPEFRPDDTQARGYGVLIEYPVHV